MGPMIPRLKRQTKKRHSAKRVYHWTVTAAPTLPIIGAPITPDVLGGFTVTGTWPSKRAIRRDRMLRRT